MLERAFRGHPSGAAVVVDVRTRQGARAVLQARLRPERDERQAQRRARARAEREPVPAADRQDAVRDLLPGLDLQADQRAGRAAATASSTTRTRVECRGFYQLGNRRFRCEHVHGEIDMREALVQSCNVYFYKLAEQVGMDRLARYRAATSGSGEKTGIGINTEAAASSPRKSWYEQRGETLPRRLHAQRRDRSGQHARHADAAGDGLRRDRQRRHAVRAAAGRERERARRHACSRSSSRACAARSASSPSTSRCVHDALCGVVNDPKRHRLRRAHRGRRAGRRQDRHRAGRAAHLRDKDDDKRAWYVYRAPRLVRGLRAGRGARSWRSWCWSSTAAAAARYAAPIAIEIAAGRTSARRQPRPTTGARPDARRGAADGTSARRPARPVRLAAVRDRRPRSRWSGVTNLYSATSAAPSGMARHLHPADLLARAGRGRGGAGRRDRLPPLRAPRLGRLRHRRVAAGAGVRARPQRARLGSAGSRSARSRCSRAS